MKPCEEYRLLISRRLDNDLDRDGEGRLQEHLAQCAGCRKAAVDYEGIKNILSAVPEGLSAAGARQPDLNLRRPKARARPAFNWKMKLAAAFILAMTAYSGYTIYQLAAPAAPETAGLTSHSAGLPAPLNTLIYYQEFAGGAVRTSVVQIEEPAGAYESPLFHDTGVWESRYQALLVSTVTYEYLAE
jgi:hypothetical protein